jgi:hypothetical protein
MDAFNAPVDGGGDRRTAIVNRNRKVQSFQESNSAEVRMVRRP